MLEHLPKMSKCSEPLPFSKVSHVTAIEVKCNNCNAITTGVEFKSRDRNLGAIILVISILGLCLGGLGLYTAQTTHNELRSCGGGLLAILLLIPGVVGLFIGSANFVRGSINDSGMRCSSCGSNDLSAL